MTVLYNDIGLKTDNDLRDYRYWNMKFNSTTPIFTSQFSIKIPAGDFNRTMNYTTKPLLSGSLPSGSNVATYANMRNELTGSDWSPYFNQIHLYRNQPEEPVISANLPRAVKSSILGESLFAGGCLDASLACKIKN